MTLEITGTESRDARRRRLPQALLALSAATFALMLALPALADQGIPDCLGAAGALPVDNEAVLQLKTSTPNQYLARAHVSGTIEQVYADEHGHNHFELQIGPAPTDTIEIVYNISFGELPALSDGMTVEACGDYITSDAATSQYPASPDNAIMHWVHRNPKGHGHASGFLAIDGQLYGQGNGQGE